MPTIIEHAMDLRFELLIRMTAGKGQYYERPLQYPRICQSRNNNYLNPHYNL